MDVEERHAQGVELEHHAFEALHVFGDHGDLDGDLVEDAHRAPHGRQVIVAGREIEADRIEARALEPRE